MIIGVISDTHNSIARTQRAMELFHEHNCELLLHCGDLANAPIVKLCSQLTFHFVIGNHDDESVLQQAASEHGATSHGELMDLSVGGHRIMMTHGHLKSPGQAIKTAAPDYHLFGHSHVAMDEVSNTTRQINPGALYRTKHPSVAIINTRTNDVEFLLVPK